MTKKLEKEFIYRPPKNCKPAIEIDPEVSKAVLAAIPKSVFIVLVSSDLDIK